MLFWSCGLFLAILIPAAGVEKLVNKSDRTIIKAPRPGLAVTSRTKGKVMREASIDLSRALLVVALLVGIPLLAPAQNREKFIISAKAGGVNAVTGRATVRGPGSTEWQQLLITENLDRGEVVKTGHDGRVEILLNPGSFMRIAENSEFELSDNSLENLEVRLTRGTAIMEITGADDSELLINISTPHTRMAIVRRGLYRVNVVPGDSTELIVRKGRVTLEGSHTKIKGGHKVTFSDNNGFSVAKLDKLEKKPTGSFEQWSKQRAETVAQVNRKIKLRDVNALLAGLNGYGLGFSGRMGGMWVFSPRFGCYTFLPFYYGWGSPYGGAYANSFSGGYFGRNGCCRGRGDNGAPRSGGFPTSSGGGSPSGNSAPSRTPGEVPMTIQGKVGRLGDRMP